MTYILVSEIVPTSVRTETAILCNSWEQLLQFGVLQLHSTICGDYGPHYLHWGFAITSSIGAIFVWIFVPGMVTLHIKLMCSLACNLKLWQFVERSRSN